MTLLDRLLPETAGAPRGVRVAAGAAALAALGGFAAHVAVLAAGRGRDHARPHRARDRLPEGWATDLGNALVRHGVPASRLRIEIPEDALMADPERALRVVEGLVATGIGVSVDDFGTGYSSLGLLKHLPVDELKIDRTFVRDLLHDASDAAIVQSVVDLGLRLRLRTVAEGVEDEATLERLREYGVTLAQGFHSRGHCRPTSSSAGSRAAPSRPERRPAASSPPPDASPRSAPPARPPPPRPTAPATSRSRPHRRSPPGSGRRSTRRASRPSAAASRSRAATSSSGSRSTSPAAR